MSVLGFKSVLLHKVGQSYVYQSSSRKGSLGCREEVLPRAFFPSLLVPSKVSAVLKRIWISFQSLFWSWSSSPYENQCKVLWDCSSTLPEPLKEYHDKGLVWLVRLPLSNLGCINQLRFFSICIGVCGLSTAICFFNKGLACSFFLSAVIIMSFVWKQPLECGTRIVDSKPLILIDQSIQDLTVKELKKEKAGIKERFLQGEVVSRCLNFAPDFLTLLFILRLSILEELQSKEGQKGGLGSARETPLARTRGVQGNQSIGRGSGLEDKGEVTAEKSRGVIRKVLLSVLEKDGEEVRVLESVWCREVRDLVNTFLAECNAYVQGSREELEEFLVTGMEELLYTIFPHIFQIPKKKQCGALHECMLALNQLSLALDNGDSVDHWRQFVNLRTEELFSQAKVYKIISHVISLEIVKKSR